MHELQFDRRRFVVGAITLTGAAVTLGPSVIIGLKAWAQDGPATPARETLAQIARHMFPHETIDDAVYIEVLDQAMSMVADDAMFGQLLRETTEALGERGEQPFIEATPEAQLTALKSIRHQPYFGTILGAVANRLYSHPKIWALLGYEGPSFGKGGYLHRGSGDIDWLPEGGS